MQGPLSAMQLVRAWAPLTDVAEAFQILTITVVEGEPFQLPEGAVILNTEPVHWAMDGKARRQVVYILPADEAS